MKSFRKSELVRRARKGHRGEPVATVAFYGPDRRLGARDRAEELSLGAGLRYSRASSLNSHAAAS